MLGCVSPDDQSIPLTASTQKDNNPRAWLVKWQAHLDSQIEDMKKGLVRLKEQTNTAMNNNDKESLEIAELQAKTFHCLLQLYAHKNVLHLLYEIIMTSRGRDTISCAENTATKILQLP